MDDRRFDSLVKALAAGRSRRALFKGVFGLGGATLIGGALLADEADAARRPAPTQTPPKCPGQQTWNGLACACPSGLDRCGPDCCNASGIPDTPSYSECCDGACCYGHCYGEELCCEYPLVFCEAQNECCGPDQNQCCGSMGCCDHECCPVAGGAGACCEAPNAKCCAGDACIPADGCCTDEDCGSGCQTCQGHVCRDDNSQCAGCLACKEDQCVPDVTFCADDGDVCTDVVCNEDGSCSYPKDCTNATNCCDDAPACYAGTCNQSSGQCDFSELDCKNYPGSDPNFCCSTGEGQLCGDDGKCYVPCAETNESCESMACCDSGEKCYDIEGEASFCQECIGNGVPCGVACFACCGGTSYSFPPAPLVMFCGTCKPLGAICTGTGQCCDGVFCGPGVCIPDPTDL